MLRSVKLEVFPDGLSFPEQLCNRISYDPASRELRFEGFMSKTDFDKLVRLHNDIGYQRSIERLFQICTFESDTPATGRRSKMFIAAGVSAAIVAITIAALLLGHHFPFFGGG
ncbi:MAG: hypothetical protein HYV60_00155 [Planctomycetia bacterium]|nr:hypothetical protein [Planctomycetia bacterium]